MDNDDFDALCRQLAEQIKAARLQANLSQEALALAADVYRTYVSHVERGVANPSLLILHRLAQTLKLELRVVFVAAPEGKPSR